MNYLPGLASISGDLHFLSSAQPQPHKYSSCVFEIVGLVRQDGIPVIPALGRLRQEDLGFEARIAGSCLKKKKISILK
jgi:hypothetical protein